MKKKEVTLLQAQMMLANQIKSEIFTCVFVKKDGEIRSMNCRKGVSKYVTGAGLKFDPKEYDLLTVFDMQKKAYRMINMVAVKEIHFQNTNFVVKGA